MSEKDLQSAERPQSLTQEEIRQYFLNRGQACPKCGSPTGRQGVAVNPPTVIIEARCIECNFNWEDAYELTEIDGHLRKNHVPDWQWDGTPEPLRIPAGVIKLSDFDEKPRQMHIVPSQPTPPIPGYPPPIYRQPDLEQGGLSATQQVDFSDLVGPEKKYRPG